MLIYSMSVSVDGFITDREGGIEWGVPSEEQFRFHLAQVGELGGYLCGRRLYETMLPWETDPSMREQELGATFADVWCAIPKVVLSRTLESGQGNARLAEASIAEEVAAALNGTDRDVSIGGPAWPGRRSSSASSTSCASSGIRLSSVAARRSCPRSPNRSRCSSSRPGRSVHG